MPRPDGERPTAAPGRLVALAAAVLLAGVAVQARLFVPRVVALDRHARTVAALLEGPASAVDPALSPVFAWRSLPALAARIPEDARVLLVSGTFFPAQYHYYFQPRPFTFLQPLEPRLLQTAIERHPAMAEALRDQFARLEAKGLRLTPERLREELSRADYLVLFRRPEPPAEAGIALELVARDDVAALYRVVRG